MVQDSSKEASNKIDTYFKATTTLLVHFRLLALSFSEFNWQAGKGLRLASIRAVGGSDPPSVCQKEAFLAIRNSN